MNKDTLQKFINFRAFVLPFFERKTTTEVSDLTIDSLKATDEEEKKNFIAKIAKIQEQVKWMKAIPDQIFITIVMSFVTIAKKYDFWVKLIEADLEDTTEEQFFEFVASCSLLVQKEMDLHSGVIQKIDEELVNIDKEKTPTAFEDMMKKRDIFSAAQEKRQAFIALCSRPKTYFDDWKPQEKNKFLRYVKLFYELSCPPKEEQK